MKHELMTQEDCCIWWAICERGDLKQRQASHLMRAYASLELHPQNREAFYVLEMVRYRREGAAYMVRNCQLGGPGWNRVRRYSF